MFYASRYTVRDWRATFEFAGESHQLHWRLAFDPFRAICCGVRHSKFVNGVRFTKTTHWGPLLISSAACLSKLKEQQFIKQFVQLGVRLPFTQKNLPYGLLITLAMHESLVSRYFSADESVNV